MSRYARTETSDEALIAAARRGEARAFAELLERHESVVLRVLRLMGVPPQDRDDVAQDVFIRVFRHLNGFQRGRPFAAWIHRVTLNVAHDYRKSLRRRAVEDSLEAEVEASGVGNDPHETAEREELRRHLLRALDALTDRERAVFVLRELEGLDTRSVALALGVSTITVRRHLGRARERLRRTLRSPLV